MLARCILLAIVCCFIGAPDTSQALTMAVFPIEDLSQGQNGVNLELTDYLAWEMNRRGFDVIGNDTIVSFMDRNRVRWLGFLDTRHLILAKDEMGADLVLFGTMSLRGDALSPSYGLTLYLVRTSDTKTLWTSSGGLAQEDVVKLLGIGETKQGQGLLPHLAQDVLATWPNELEYNSKSQHALEIEDIELAPTHVRRGEKVVCNVRLRNTWPEEDAPRIFFKAAGRVYMARKESPGDIYRSDWEVAENDGRYPVTMVINWPSGHKKVSFLGAYNVDSSPPKLVLDLKGVQLEGTVAFRDQVIIIPRMLRREPVARWKLTVEDENGEEQLSYTGYGEMPNRFVWNGKGKEGWPAAEGLYKVSLQVWDRAENSSVASQPVAVARTPPAMILEAKNRGRDMIIDLSHDGKVPIAFWRMEMRSTTGEMIKVAEGSDLPVRMDVRMPNKVIKIADGLRSPGDSSDGKIIKVADGEEVSADSNSQKIIKVAEGHDTPANDKRTIIKVAQGEDRSNGGGATPKIIKVAEGQDATDVEKRKIIKVAEGDNSANGTAGPRKIIKVAGGQDATDIEKRKIIKVAEGDDSVNGTGGSRKIIKVAEGQDTASNEKRKIIKVAEGESTANGIVAPRKVIKVAEGDESMNISGTRRKVIKVADGSELPIIEKRNIIVLAGGEPYQADVVAPEDKDTRKVECIVTLRDVLGNQTKTKIADLIDYAEKQLVEESTSAGSQMWVDEF